MFPAADPIVVVIVAAIAAIAAIAAALAAAAAAAAKTDGGSKGNHGRRCRPTSSSTAWCLSAPPTRASSVARGVVFPDGGGGGGDATMAIDRRERARVFARMFSPSGGGGRVTPPRAPPDRGANVVVTMRSDDARCVRLQKALYLLGTYYNLFVQGHGVKRRRRWREMRGGEAARRDNHPTT